MVLHSVLSRCLVSLPEDCNFKMGNHVDQFFRIYQLKPLMRKQPSQNIQSSPDRLSLSLPPSEKKALPSHIEKLMAKPPPKPTACGQCTKCRKHKGCRKVARWNAKYARDTPEESLSSPFFVWTKAASTVAATTQTTPPSVNSLSPPFASEGPGFEKLASVVSDGKTPEDDPSLMDSFSAQSLFTSSSGNTISVDIAPPIHELKLPPSKEGTKCNPSYICAKAESEPEDRWTFKPTPEGNRLRRQLVEEEKERERQKEENRRKRNGGHKFLSQTSYLNNNSKRLYSLNSFSNMKKAKWVDEGDLPCICDDCRYVSLLNQMCVMLSSNILQLAPTSQVCNRTSCCSNAGQGHLLQMPSLQACQVRFGFIGMSIIVSGDNLL